MNYKNKLIHFGFPSTSAYPTTLNSLFLAISNFQNNLILCGEFNVRNVLPG